MGIRQRQNKLFASETDKWINVYIIYTQDKREHIYYITVCIIHVFPLMCVVQILRNCMDNVYSGLRKDERHILSSTLLFADSQILKRTLQ